MGVCQREVYFLVTQEVAVGASPLKPDGDTTASCFVGLFNENEAFYLPDQAVARELYRFL